MKKKLNLFLATMLSTSIVAGSAIAANNPANLKDDAFVTLNGTVASFDDEDEFMLKYGGGTIKVDTNDSAFAADDAMDAKEILKKGDKVTVTGYVDDNLFTGKEVEATSIRHGSKLYSHDYRDEIYATEDYKVVAADEKYMTNGQTRLVGTVTKIEDEDTVMMKYGKGELEVDLNSVKQDKAPVKVGDRIAAYGNMDDNWFTDKHFEAESFQRLSMY